LRIPECARSSHSLHAYRKTEKETERETDKVTQAFSVCVQLGRVREWKKIGDCPKRISKTTTIMVKHTHTHSLLSNSLFIQSVCVRVHVWVFLGVDSALLFWRREGRGEAFRTNKLDGDAFVAFRYVYWEEGSIFDRFDLSRFWL
jgi:hypothetical protein